MNNLIPRNIFSDGDFDYFFSIPAKNDMKCDIYEKDNKYHIEMDVPGFNKEDIKIEVNENNLTIKASKTKEENEENKNYIRRERSYGEYQRSFILDEVDTDKIDAKFDKGILTITVPKKEIVDNKRIIEIE